MGDRSDQLGEGRTAKGEGRAKGDSSSFAIPSPFAVRLSPPQGLIQVAAGLLHLQRRNARGARNKLAEGLAKLTPYEPAHRGIEVTEPVITALTASFTQGWDLPTALRAAVAALGTTGENAPRELLPALEPEPWAPRPRAPAPPAALGRP